MRGGGHGARRARGFTLIEMLIAMVILSVLAAVALPSYRGYVLRTNRTVGKSALSKIVQDEESYFADRQRYNDLYDIGYPAGSPTASVYVDTDGTINQAASANTVYSVSMIGRASGDVVSTCTLSGSWSSTDFVVMATPMNNQLNDQSCANMCLAATGEKGASGSNGSSSCWTR